MPKSRQEKTSPAPAVKTELKKNRSHIETPPQTQLERSSILHHQDSGKFIYLIQSTEKAKFPYRQVETDTNFSEPNPTVQSNAFSQYRWKTLQPRQSVDPLRRADWNFDSRQKSSSRPFPIINDSDNHKQMSHFPESNFVVEEKSSTEILNDSKVVTTESKTDAEGVAQPDQTEVGIEEAIVIQEVEIEPKQSSTIIPTPPVETPSRIQVAEILMPPMVQQPVQSSNSFGMTAMFVIGFALAAGCLYVTGRFPQQQIPSVIKLVVQADELFSKLQLNSSSFALATPGSQLSTTAVVDLESEPHIIPIMGQQTFMDRESEKSALQQERSEEICKALFEENLNLQKNFAST